MRARQSLLVAGFTSFALTGCNWGSFDSLLDKAPVVLFTPPGPSTSSAFVLPLAVPAEANATSAARMLVSRSDSDYLAVADFDLNGKVTLTAATERSSLRGAPVVGAAVRPDGLIMLGVPGAGGGLTPGGGTVSLSLMPIPGGGYTFAMQPVLQGGGATRLGLAVAAGNVTGSGADFVVVGDNSLHVVGADGKEAASTSCLSVQFGGLTTENYPFRPLAVGDLLAGSNDEIVLGGNGKVTFIQWNGTSTLFCSPDYLTKGASLNFGSSLAVADFDGNGAKDLAVGAPPDKVYVYFGPLDRYFDPVNPVTAPSVTITNRLPNTSFGQRIAAYQLPGTTTAQLLVADPTAPVGSSTGKVMLFNVTGAVDMTDADAVATLFDSAGDSGLFGMSLGGLTFNPQLCLPGTPAQLVPWATSNLDVLTFFEYPVSTAPGAVAPDPRCFALKP